MSNQMQVYLGWTRSKIGRQATLGNAVALIDRTRPNFRIGQGISIADLNRRELDSLVKQHGNEALIKDILKTQRQTIER